MSFLKDKKILIVGVANKFSIAAGIAKSMSEQGAELFLSYQSERLLKKVTQVGDPLGCKNYFECDVSDDESIKSSFKSLMSGASIMIAIIASLANSSCPSVAIFETLARS